MLGFNFCPFFSHELNVYFLSPTNVRVDFDLAETSLSKEVFMYVFKKSLCDEKITEQLILVSQKVLLNLVREWKG